MKRPRRSGAIVPAVAMVCVMASTAAIAETNTPAVEKTWSPITSHHRNFVVTDLPRRDALEIAVWAESVRERLTEWVGAPIPFDRTYPLVLGAETMTNDASGRVLKAQQFTDDGFLQQEITMVNPAVMDQEDVLEALCWMMINRWIYARQSPEERVGKPRTFPDWLAVGVAQNLYPALRARNYQETVERERDGEYRPAVSTLGNMYLSPGRWPEKAMAGLVVAWLTEIKPADQVVSAAAAHLADGGVCDVAFIGKLLGLLDERSLNMSWDVWMARQGRRLAPGVMSSDYREIARILTLPVEEFGLVMPSPAIQLSVEMLIQQRDETWVHRYSRAVAWRLRQDAIGKTPELVARAGDFILFFDALAAPGLEDDGKKGKVQSVRWLTETWNKANSAWSQYLSRQQEQETLLNRHSSGGTNAVTDMLNRWEP